MDDLTSGAKALKKLKSAKRRSVNLNSLEWVKTNFLETERSLPLVISPAIDGVNLFEWIEKNRAWIEQKLQQYGGLLFRGFPIENIEHFHRLIQTTTNGDLLEYTYRSTPRTQLKQKIYTSTEYPADRFISMHNENAYSKNWPLKIWFCCLQPATQGGETLIADSRKVFERISPAVRQKFADKGVAYIRNYGEIDLSWQDVFQTSNPTEVETYCRQAGIEFEWKSENRLRTRQVCQAIATHPKTGEKVWFNVAHIFHISNLDKDVQSSLRSLFQLEELPRHATYGDGSPLEEEILQDIRVAYEAETFPVPWQKGDVLMLDNMLVAHGRNPFMGQRKVVVGMAESYSVI